MGTPVVSPAVRRSRAGWLLVVTVVGLLVMTGCGATGVDPDPAPTATSAAPSASASASAGASIPADGIGLSAFGIQNGPAQFSIPRAALATSVVDQPNNVVLVLSAPAPAEVGGYLRRTLPGAGFMISGADPAGTFRFDGHGWTGSFTTSEGTSAILLRPR